MPDGNSISQHISRDSNEPTSLERPSLTVSVSRLEIVDRYLQRRSNAQAKPQQSLFREPVFTLTPSTFLKLSMLSQKVAKTEIRNRILKTTKPYDRSRVLRNLITRTLVEGSRLRPLIARARRLNGDAERRDTVEGLLQFWRWKRARSIKGATRARSMACLSPNRLFAVRVRPEAVVLYEDTLASLVTYNTRDPHLNERYGKIGASLVEWVFANNGCAGKHGHQILALRTPENYTLHPEEHDYLKDDLLRHIVQIELLILEVIEEIEAPVP